MYRMKKIVLIPMRIIIFMVKLVVKLVIEIESIALGLFMIVIGLCLLICIWQKMWDSLGGFAVIGIAVFAIVFVTSLMECAVELIEAWILKQ